MPEVLVFVEDPGAANYVRHLKQDLNKDGVGCLVMTSGVAVSYLRQQGVESKQLHGAALDMLRYYEPQVVLVGTSANLQTAGLAFVQEARARRIVSVGLVDALPNVAYRWSGEMKDPLAFAPDVMLVPDQAIRRAFEKLGYPRERLVEIGYPFVSDVAVAIGRLAGRDRVALKRHLLPDWRGQKVLGFVSEGSRGQSAKSFPGAADRNFEGRGQRSGRTEVALDEFLDAAAGLASRPYVSVRLHPKQHSSCLKEYQDEIDFVSQGGG